MSDAQRLAENVRMAFDWNEPPVDYKAREALADLLRLAEEANILREALRNLVEWFHENDARAADFGRLRIVADADDFFAALDAASGDADG